VAGCGPGGMASALFLKRAGFEVVLFDQFAEPRPVGSGLLIQPSGQAVLAELGLLDAIRQRAASVRGLFGINNANGKRALDMEYSNLGLGVVALGIHRASLFDVMFEAAGKAGIPINSGAILQNVAPTQSGVGLAFENGSEETGFDLVINATGANGPLGSGAVHILPFGALWTTMDIPPAARVGTCRLDQRYHRASKMAGIMPIGINPVTGNQGAALFWSVKPEEAPTIMKNGIDAWRREFLDLWPGTDGFVAQIHSLDDFTLATYRHRTGTLSSHPRVFHVGDAWHCTSPQLGQGANMALMDAFALAKAIEYAGSLASITNRYRHARADHVRLYQWLSYIFTPLYQSDSRLLPVMRDAAIHHFAKWPVVRSLIAKVVSGSLGSSYVSRHP
jgi:salicylate hydroxylase